MRITDSDLKRELKRLNDTFGFKGYNFVKLKSGKGKFTGKGFDIDSAYGGVKLVFKKAPSTSQRSISSGYGTKKSLFEEMQAMRKGIDTYKRRSKL